MTDHPQPGIPTIAKSWRRISITAPSSTTDLISSFLCDITDQGIEQTEGGDNMEIITAYLPESPEAGTKQRQIEQFLSRLQAALPPEQKLKFSLSSLQDEDWNRQWKKHFKPEHLTSRLVIKPTWEDYSPARDEQVIEMDPGIAFGTGHHASTRLSAQLIERMQQGLNPPRTILDVGTGTGILAMTAVLLGAQSARAIDNDPEAVLVAEENIQRNHLEDKIKTSGADLQDIAGNFDLVIANIIHDTLLFLAPQLVAKVGRNGHLILAGILAGEQQQSITETYTGLGLHHLAELLDGEWAALLFSK